MAAREMVKMHDERIVLVPPRPLTFEEFVDSFGEDDEVELIDGVVVERMAAQLDHERLQVWLLWLLNGYVRAKELGIVLGSRTAVKITEHQARLPDILFVRKESQNIVQQKGIYGPPDLIVEILSPNDRPADIISMEADYWSIGVPEIWLIDRNQRHVRILDKSEQGYEENVLTHGLLASQAVEGFWLEVEWLLAESLPVEMDILQRLLEKVSPESGEYR